MYRYQKSAVLAVDIEFCDGINVVDDFFIPRCEIKCPKALMTEYKKQRYDIETLLHIEKEVKQSQKEIESCAAKPNGNMCKEY